MTLNKSEPQIRKILIKAETGRSLQSQVTEAIKDDIQRVVLEGSFISDGKKPFSLLTLNQDLEIVGRNGTTLDGQNQLAHLVFIKDGVRVKIKGINFTNGNTGDIQSQLSLDNHPRTRLNIFRYLDGGAITTGAGSELILEDCNFENNHSAICGGAISNLGGYINLINCSFSDNSCGDTGAAIDNLVAGSLTIIEKGRFNNNRANQLGTGTFGAVTAFPDTYLVVKDSDFSLESSTAIDYRPNKEGLVFVAIDRKSVFDSQNPNTLVKNPISNRGTRKEIFVRYTRLLSKHPDLVKLEGVPSANRTTVEKHCALFEKLIADQQSRALD